MRVPSVIPGPLPLNQGVHRTFWKDPGSGVALGMSVFLAKAAVRIPIRGIILRSVSIAKPCI